MKRFILIFWVVCFPLFGFSKVDSLQLPILLGEVHYASVFDSDRQLVATLVSKKDASNKLSKLPDGNYLLVKSDATFLYVGDFRIKIEGGEIVDFLSLPERPFSCKPSGGNIKLPNSGSKKPDK